MRSVYGVFFGVGRSGRFPLLLGSGGGGGPTLPHGVWWTVPLQFLLAHPSTIKVGVDRHYSVKNERGDLTIVCSGFLLSSESADGSSLLRWSWKGGTTVFSSVPLVITLWK